MQLHDALRGTGSVRRFTDDPLPDSTISEILNDARFAPSGGNRQPWRVAVIKDRAVRRALGDLIAPVWDEYSAISATGRTPFTVVDPAPYELESTRAGNVPNDLIDNIESVPGLLVVAADFARLAMMDAVLEREPITGGASVYPFCWSILLASRARGLGGVITTFLSHVEPAAAPLLGLPDNHGIAAMIFLGTPVHQPTKLKRRPVATFATIDRFDGDALTG